MCSLCHFFVIGFEISLLSLNTFLFHPFQFIKVRLYFLATFACFLVCLFFSIQNENVLIYQRLFIFRSITGFSSYLYAILFMVSLFDTKLRSLRPFFHFLSKRKN